MVNFKKRLAGKKIKKPIEPIELYDTLDRAHDKGPLRPAQISVLSDWFKTGQKNRDSIIKLHTGQGKTLVGLLLLQSRLNDNKGPALYLCPDNFLIAQTCEQAKQFGIATCMTDPEIPDDFLNSKKILVTSVQKLFNGLTKFGLFKRAEDVGTLLMDDAHACADRIREACRIRIPNDSQVYNDIKEIFSVELEEQGVGTFADICNKKRDAFLPVPYWAWFKRKTEIARILSANAEQKIIKFSWPLLKNMLNACQCIVSGTAIEIEPYIPPLKAFGSYWHAPHRVFMSATVTDDAFLVKGLQLEPNTIINPITYSKESWSGEKMILMPSLIHEDLSKERIVKFFGSPNGKRKYGRVAHVPSFLRSKDWEACGAIVITKDNVTEAIRNLKNGDYEKTLVLANRYDGIDLPDDTCRILIFDGRPYSESLIDLYQESCRQNSEATLMRTIRTVEQGLGRSVRGEKDYSVIVIVGSDIIKLVRNRQSRKYLSPQMATQIEIGLELVDMAQQEIENGEKPNRAFGDLIKQCLTRDEDWKSFYIDQMSCVKPSGANEKILKAYHAELSAEDTNLTGDYNTACEILQDLLDTQDICIEDRAWYLQEMARYNFSDNRVESQKLQIAAHKKNRLLLKPSSGVTVAKLTILNHGRLERIVDWISNFEDYSSMNIVLSDILGQLVFGVKADKFEQAIDDLSRALGFAGERPDKEWKEGPDNLWALDDTNYIVWECKNEVKTTRSEINKREAEQMNRSCAWFEKHYPGLKAKNILIHPSKKIESAAALTHDVEVMRVNGLKEFINTVRDFYKSFETVNFKDLSVKHIQKVLNSHKLNVDDLLNNYTEKPKDKK